ncbi:ABC transporter substrate-binding protein [Paenibacillus periandrae]|uniref:ABC transporter substrate-binding protein n=1 Tax=Paenibacillus periandrae TaxID=1761741 RepID=UPI001F08DFBF|nr:extracellular solute-binding protein [Paenibacillus periandrae]
MKPTKSALAIIAAFSVLFTACSKDGKRTDEQNQQSLSDKPVEITEPVNLIFYVSGATFTATEFKNQIKDPVEKKFKHITIDRLEPPSTVTVPELFSSGTVPDLVFGDNYHTLKKLKVVEDLRPWFKKYNFDESRIKPYLTGYIHSFGDNGEIYGVPYNSNQHILYYNKDVFDKFGVPYPSDEQMTWEQALDLARQLTRTENGVQYIGLDAEGLTYYSRSLALATIDPITGKSLLGSPDWLRVFNITKANFEIPGFLPKDNTKYLWGRDVFMKDRTMAMRPAWLANMVGPMEELRQQGIDVNWDIAPVPTFADQLGKTRETQVHSITMTSLSKKKDAAFQVIQYLLSDEAQRIISRNGRVPAIINPELEKEYGAEVGTLKGKKIQNIFVGTPLQTHKSNQFETDIAKYMTEANLDLAHGLDVNSTIRKASENINKEVERLQKNQ